MEKKGFKCTGICSQCGRCKSAKMITSANNRKTKLLEFPDDFIADKGSEGYGVAFDIGTTTIVAMLWDLEEGKLLDSRACTNPQNEYGSDVISRITYCGGQGEKLKELQKKTHTVMSELILNIVSDFIIDYRKINKITVGGNTTMSHIFAGYDPKPLALVPFTPAYTGTLELTAQKCRLTAGKKATVTVLPNIAGHVGGDITAGIVATRLLNKKELTLFVDIGTNGELVLVNGNRALTCSTAAGPAFEGATIKNGMRAAAGAIEKVTLEEGEIAITTIEGMEPVGICGSGLIDAVAVMIKSGVVNKSGRILSAEDYDTRYPEGKMGKRLRTSEEGREFVLVFKEDGEDIAITQQDIREVQLAKGAISAGVSIMLSLLESTVCDLKNVIIAGAFGNFIDVESAVTIGLLPKVDLSKIHSLGNTAGAGVSMALCNEEDIKLAKDIPNRVEHIELAACENFQNEYVGAMGF